MLLIELVYIIQLLSIFYCDNWSCIATIKNLRFHNMSKHIDIIYHFLEEKVDNKILQLEFTPTTHMWMDMLTKCLPKPKHQICVATHGLIGFNELTGKYY